MSLDHRIYCADCGRVGACIRKEREALGFSQAELATEAGLPRPSLTNIETGRQHIPPCTLYRIADALAVPITTLLPANQQVGARLKLIEEPESPERQEQ